MHKMRNTPFFIGKHVRLRALEPSDVDFLYEAENDTSSWDVANATVPYSKYVLRQYVAQSQSDMFADCQLRLMIVCNDGGETIGTVDLTDFSPMHRRGELGIAIKAAWQHRGYAREAIGLMADYAFRFLRLKQLTVHIAADNARSLSLVKDCGFEECGVLRAWWRVEDAYKDVVILQLIRERYEENCSSF